MVYICWYFQVHQPFRLKKYSLFNIKDDTAYFDDELNEQIMKKVAHKCYLPMNALLLKLLNKHKELNISFSISGVAIEQMQRYCPQVLESFKALVNTGQVELLSETYYHSLSSLYSKEEFYEQIAQHTKLMKHHFNVTPQVFRNTELIYSNAIAKDVAQLGFKGMLLEGWDPVLNWKSPNYIYSDLTNSLKLLTKNYTLSDNIAFRFSNKDWVEYPLTAEKFTTWINESALEGEVINLFMDYETFGEHQWEETGIFDFMEKLPQTLLQNKHLKFVTPTQAITLPSKDSLDIHSPLSWADTERDISAWVENSMQKESLQEIYSLHKDVKKYGDLQDISTWKKLTTSDHFYYMCTKYFEDGDVHKYFSCYDSPYEAYLYYKNVVRSFKKIIEDKKLKAQKETEKLNSIQEERKEKSDTQD